MPQSPFRLWRSAYAPLTGLSDVIPAGESLPPGRTVTGQGLAGRSSACRVNFILVLVLQGDFQLLPGLRRWFGFEFRLAQGDRLRQCFKPRLERLEDRVAPAAWYSIGPAPINNGFGPQAVTGRITGLVADPSDANIIYIAAAGGGVWKTVNGGSNWTSLTATQSTRFTGSIAVAPGTGINNRIIYAGTGEANFSGDSFYGRGVLVSKDSGVTWTLTGNSVFDRVAIGKVVIDPTDMTGNTAYAAVSGEASNGKSVFSSGYGIYKTTNGGVTWTNTIPVALVSPTGFNPFTDLVMDPHDHNTLFAAVGEPFAFGGSFGAANDVYETTNGGMTWSATTFPGGSSTGRITLAIQDVGAMFTPTIYASVSDPRFSPSPFGQLL